MRCAIWPSTYAACALSVRIDTVDLEHIHEVVMKLSRIAETHDGSYDGWETSVEKPPAS